MTNALNLRPGDRVPDFALPGLDGKLHKFIWSFTGDPVALLVVEDLGLLDAASFDGLRAACREARVTLVVVAGTALAAAATAWARLGGQPEDPLLLCDPERRFLPALLAQGAMGLGPGTALRQRIVVLDPNQRVATVFDQRPLATAVASLATAVAPVRAEVGGEFLLRTAMAPVLVLPRVFEPDFCRQVIRLWEKGDHKDTGVSSRYGNVNVARLKQTEDYTVVEPVMQKAISDRLAWRIGPELIKVFAFDRQFSFDAHVVLSYSAEGHHFFGAHRDNGAPNTADRAFAVSLNLNDDFEGGELVFPEYAGVRVVPPPGAAAVFSCSLLHEVKPVTRGRRFALTTFFRAR